MSETKPCLSVILVAYFGRTWLEECLNSLLVASKSPIHLVLVDNGNNSGDLAQLPVEKFKTTILSTPEEQGFAEANNFALQSISIESEAVCFLNQDTISEPGWLDECMRVLQTHPEIGAVSPLLKTYSGEDWDPGFLDCSREKLRSMIVSSDGEASPEFTETEFVTGAAMVVRTEALLKTGPFDPIYGSYYEDFDLCLRIRQTGYRIGYCGRAVVRHYSGSSTTTDAANKKRMRQIIRNRAILNLRKSPHHRWRRIVKQLGFSLPYNLLRSLARTASSQPLSVQLLAHWDLLKLLPRLGSPKQDKKARQSYLSSIDWPESQHDSQSATEREFSQVS